SAFQELRLKSQQLRLQFLEQSADFALAMAHFAQVESQSPEVIGVYLKSAQSTYHYVLNAVATGCLENGDTSGLRTKVDRLRSVMASLGGSALQPPAKSKPAPTNEALTARETEVLRSIAAGHSTKETAFELGISFKTACTHRYRLMDKLGI